MKYYFIFILFLFSSFSFAQEDVSIELEQAPVNIHDIRSIKRGAKIFASTCMVCHTAIYMRYDKLAQESGVLYSKMPIKVTVWPFGVKPPDLSLEVNRRGANWVYTYLHSFYVDPSRPTGVNNLLVPNTAMSGILMPYQGRQIRVPLAKIGKQIYRRGYQWYDLVEIQSPGSMTSEQFDVMITDIVNFLVYASEPYKAEQERIGLWVLSFLILLFIFVYLLKRSYWKAIKRSDST